MTKHTDIVSPLVRATDTVRELRQRVKELEAGACRFHCQTAKENWVAGYKTAAGRPLTFANQAEMQYDSWKSTQG